MRVDLRLFGVPELKCDGRPVAMGLKRGWALLSYLAVSEGGQGRDTLTALLWPEAGPEAGRSRLRRLVHRLPRACSQPLVTAAGDALGLNPYLDFEVDVIAYRTALKGALQMPRGPAQGRALSRALECCRGDFLEGFGLPDSEAFDEWQLQQAEDLRQSFRRGLMRLADIQAAAGELDMALASARRLLRTDPLDEASHRRLMTLYAAAGSPGEALRQFRECAEVLNRELGVEPETLTGELADAIRSGSLPARNRAGARPITRYVRNGDLHIAYQSFGEGPLTVLVVPGFISHLEQIWEEPGLAGFLNALGERYRVLLFDRRSVGLSDRVGYAPTLENTASDVLAVMDAAGVAEAVLFAMSEGGPSGVLLAAEHPERVAALVLWGTTAKMVREEGDDDAAWAMPRASFRRWVDNLVAGWGGPSQLEQFAPGVAGDPRFRQWWASVLRQGGSPGTVQRVMEAFMETDVRSLLGRVRRPTLVLHRVGDRMMRIEAARYLAGRIPGARLEELAGEDHWFWCGNSDEVRGHLDAFIMSLPGTARPERDALS